METLAVQHFFLRYTKELQANCRFELGVVILAWCYQLVAGDKLYSLH